MSNSNTRLYRIHQNMLQRTNNPNNKDYKYYGQKGINVDPTWLIFESFQQWALNADYNDSLTIDRLDNEKGYSAFNCRFVDRESQTAAGRRGKFTKNKLHTGVYKKGTKFKVQLTRNKKCIHLGIFEDYDKAVEAVEDFNKSNC